MYQDELRALAQSIITKQSEGVMVMQMWDCQWYGDCRNGLACQAEKRG